MRQVATWPDLIKASLAGVMVAWLVYAVWAAFDAFTGPSNDIAMAIFPVATMIALVVALMLFWPLIIAMARLVTALSIKHSWARHWWAWTISGAATGAVALFVLMSMLDGGTPEYALAATLGGSVGAISASVTFWRLTIMQAV
jgi:hypothetical protein